jgi:hypothetical protein
MDSFLDDILDSPGGSITYQDVRAAVIADVRLEICDPVVTAFQSLRQMSSDDIARFDPLRPSLPGVPLLHPDYYSDYPSNEDSATGREKPCCCASPNITTGLANMRHHPSTESFFRMSLFVRLADVWCW